MDRKNFQFRLYTVVAVMALLFLLFTAVLWDLQIIHGPDYLQQSTKRIAQLETVDAVRGEIVDRNGRVLVTNRSTYQVTLNESAMGEEAERNANLLELLEICRSEGVTWTDTFPVSQTAPYVFTLDQATNTQKNAFASLMESMKWTDPAREALEQIGMAPEEEEQTLSGFLEEIGDTAQAVQDGVYGTSGTVGGAISADALLQTMRAYYEVDPGISDEDARALLGVLYELSLRKKNATTTEYIFATDVDVRFISVVKEHKLKGVTIDATTTREYKTSYAAHLLGRVGPIFKEDWNAEDSYYKNNGYNMNDLVGKDGVESAFEESLRGQAGTPAV